ncbi:MAG: AAA family ATPase [Acidimicrobiales bacterium]
MTEPKLYVITGVMAAGKSTVAQVLAERFESSAHVRGDAFRRAIVTGRHEMSPSPTDEALEQLRLRYELTATVADRYVEAGFVTVVQDTILGPMLPVALRFFRTKPAALVVLAPTVDVVAQRETARAKTGYGAFTPADLDRVLREDTPRLGLWLDSSNQTPTETVDEILANHDAALL